MITFPKWPPIAFQNRITNDFERMQKILELLGNPHLKVPPTIHIAGTNGKGSTCAILRSIYRYAGYKVHSYTSPHILYFNERIEISGAKISDNEIFENLDEVKNICEQNNIEPSFFEGTTAAAFLAFSKNKADILILETGMGGRLDPTNVLPAPMLSVITPISFDHMDALGWDIKSIAREKAGIIKENRPCVISKQVPESMECLLDQCEVKNAPAIAYEYDYLPEKRENGFYFMSRLGDIHIDSMKLLGDHQIINAAGAIMAVLTVNQINSNLKCLPEQIQKGISKAEWIGRLQKYPLDQLLDIKTNTICYLDGAHNISGAAALADWAKSQDRKLVLIVGFTKNRDAAAFLSQFQHLNPTIFGVRVLSEPSSYTAEKLRDLTCEAGIKLEPKDSIFEALHDAAKEDNLILITGSLFLLSDALKLLKSGKLANC